MKVFFEPVNLNVWNMLENIKTIPYTETFFSTKEMNLDDLVILYVGSQKKNVAAGVYAFGVVASLPYVAMNPDDYCYKKLVVDIKIKQISYDKPIISKDECKMFIKQYYSVHKIADDVLNEIDCYLDF